MIPDRANSRLPSAADRDKAAADNSAKKDHLDDLLDEALEETFPGSDPVAVIQPVRSRERRRGG